ncbi:MAG: hypothetical protein RQ806_10705 [Erythrobacter sp.]|nr:hypothetical protein [Erythrobacter sp.]
MDISFTPYVALFAGGLVAALIAVVWVLTKRQTIGSPAIAAALCGGFAAYTGVTIWAEGVMPALVNHTSNLWGVQVWWDLLISLTIALFLIVPRARAAGMNVPLWTLFIVATASIGLAAMCARLFWLERQAAGRAA